MRLCDFQDLIGVPFVDGGRDVSTGLDCWGLVAEIFRRSGIDLPDYQISAADCLRIAQEIETERLTGRWNKHEYPLVPIPAIVVMRYNKPGIWNHTGVYLGGGRFLHTREKIGVTIERVDSPIWQRRIEGFYSPINGWAKIDISGGSQTT
jgi:cell wall-associated NlpC family hydrolase